VIGVDGARSLQVSPGVVFVAVGGISVPGGTSSRWMVVATLQVGVRPGPGHESGVSLLPSLLPPSILLGRFLGLLLLLLHLLDGLIDLPLLHDESEPLLLVLVPQLGPVATYISTTAIDICEQRMYDLRSIKLFAIGIDKDSLWGRHGSRSELAITVGGRFIVAHRGESLSSSIWDEHWAKDRVKDFPISRLSVRTSNGRLCRI
jgi:hypothetical protein